MWQNTLLTRCLASIHGYRKVARATCQMFVVGGKSRGGGRGGEGDLLHAMGTDLGSDIL